MRERLEGGMRVALKMDDRAHANEHRRLQKLENARKRTETYPPPEPSQRPALPTRSFAQGDASRAGELHNWTQSVLFPALHLWCSLARPQERKTPAVRLRHLGLGSPSRLRITWSHPKCRVQCLEEKTGTQNGPFPSSPWLLFYEQNGSYGLAEEMSFVHRR